MRTRVGGRLLLCLLAAAVPLAVVAVRSGPASWLSVGGAAGIRFEPEEVDLGCVPAGEARVATVRWRRVGPGRVRRVALQTGCGCLRAEGVPESLEEGASGTLTVRVAPRRDPGPFVLPVRAFLDVPAPEEVRALVVRGYVGEGVVALPSAIDLRARSPGARVTKRVDVCLPPDEGETAVRAVLQGLAGSVEVVPPLLARPRGRDLLVSVEAPEAAGPFSGVVVVSVPGRESVEVPVRGLVVPP